MGIHDRDYYRDEPRGWGGERPMWANLIILNVVLFVADAVFCTDQHELMRGMALESSLFREPWNAWQLLTYGFAHDPNHPLMMHLIMNMVCLWFFGRDVEGIYGRKLFLQLYLTLIILSGLCWLITSYRQPPALMGASGAVVGVMLVYVMHYPTRTIMLFGIVPLPAWLLVGAYLVTEFSAAQRNDAHDFVAHTAHLGGALFGFIFYKTQWTLFTLLPSNLLKRGIGRRPKLKLHSPEPDDESLSRRVDEILEKISREGESSLSKEERKVLEDASRRYQKRRS